MSGRTTPDGRVWIRPLPERLVNKIAAGEVVERPASVVKELVENSLDAGADRIEIIVEKSGGKLIKIVDDGGGIPEEQIEIAFSRHATSKITDLRDLDSIMSYGFRGEALPSIASVSRLRMVSRPAEADHGIEIIFEGGVLHSKKPASAAPGTTIEVENLFFNTPARRKFLKAESTEQRHISRTAMALAIGRFDVGFTFRANGREIFAEPPGQTLRERVTSLLSPGNSMIEVNGDLGPVQVHGYIGLPDQAQSNRYGQYIFINGRVVQSPTLSHAFVAGYGELMPRGNFPVGALLLTVDPAEVDVNVHPAKTEVRLSHEREIHDALYNLIKQAVRHDQVAPSFDPDKRRRYDGSVQHRRQTPAQGAGRPGNRISGIGERASTNQEFLDHLYRKSPDDDQPAEVVKVDTSTGEIVDAERRPTREDTRAQDTGEADGVRFVGRFSDLYLMFQRGEQLLILDQHTAHERVLFEETLQKMAREGIVAQQLLLPVQVELSPDQLSLFEEAESLLNKSGFDVQFFGGRTVQIQAVPSMLRQRSPEKAVRGILDDLASLKQAGYDLHKAMAQSIACRSAVMAGDRLSADEALGLLQALLKCDNSYSCPHGRPTFVRMTRDDIDRQFGRG